MLDKELVVFGVLLFPGHRHGQLNAVAYGFGLQILARRQRFKGARFQGLPDIASGVGVLRDVDARFAGGRSRNRPVMFPRPVLALASSENAANPLAFDWPEIMKARASVFSSGRSAAPKHRAAPRTAYAATAKNPALEYYSMLLLTGLLIQ
jgi:hypothetical protein